MKLNAELVLTEGDLKITVLGELPEKGKFKELIKVEYKGHPDYTIDVAGEGLLPITNRPNLRKALSVICGDLLLGQYSLDKVYQDTWHVLIKQINNKDNIPYVNVKIETYVYNLKHDYSKHQHFKVHPASVRIKLYEPVTGDDYLELKFKTQRPTKYNISCFIGSRRGGEVQHVQYTRTFGIGNPGYLLKQIIEWIETFDASIRPPVHRTANMKSGVKARFESLTPLIDNLLHNLNEGNNI